MKSASYSITVILTLSALFPAASADTAPGSLLPGGPAK